MRLGEAGDELLPTCWHAVCLLHVSASVGRAEFRPFTTGSAAQNPSFCSSQKKTQAILSTCFNKNTLSAD